MSDFTRINPPDWHQGDPLAATRLQTMTDAIRQANGFVGGPKQGEIDGFQRVLIVRLVVTDSARALQGLGTIDGRTVNDRDVILRATGGAPGSDGIFEAGLGPWRMIWRLSVDQAPNDAHVLPHGTLISVASGTSGQSQIWKASDDGTVTFV